MDIAIFTTTRAEFGILYPLIKKIKGSNNLKLKLFVGGSHLSDEHGCTINEIRNLGIKITDTFDFVPIVVNPSTILNSLAKETTLLAQIFTKYSFDAICVLGDRYELIPVIQAAILFQKPIIHIHGGEKSEGVIDEQIRHMITKSAHIHFAACEEYASNIKQMGEQSWRVFNVGALAVDNMRRINQISKEELYKDLNLDLKKQLVLLTYHPVTLKTGFSNLQQIKNIFNSLSKFNYQVLITAPNVETDREVLMKVITEHVALNPDYHYVESLGVKRYFNILPHCLFSIGNSSSGIIEVPYYKIPTVNIGDRQKGRIRHKSIIDVDYNIDSIVQGIEQAGSDEFRKPLIKMSYMFGEGNTAKKMISVLESVLTKNDILFKKLDFKC